MRTIKGPALFLAQFVSDEAPFNTLESMAKWASDLGYIGLQIPSGDKRLFDLDKAARSQAYCDDLRAMLSDHGVQITELSAHLQGQLVAVHPAYDLPFDAFAPEALRRKPAERQKWAVEEVKKTITASRRLGLKAIAAFSGALAWPYLYPWPQRPEGLIEEAFAELARLWRPILDHAQSEGIDICFELHPGEDLHDGASFELFLKHIEDHPRAAILYDPSHFVLQGLDYLQFIDIYHPRIRMFHAKDAEFNPTGRQGVYGGFQSWLDRAGRFRSLGDGQVQFGPIFAKLAQYDFQGWAVVEWECCLKHPEDGAREGAQFVKDHIIRVTPRAFDDFAGGAASRPLNREMLGLGGQR